MNNSSSNGTSHRVARKQRAQQQRRKRTAWIAGLVVVVVLAGAVVLAMPGLLHGASGFPAYVDAAGPRGVAAYQYATEDRSLLSQMPCYCGCVGVGHESLADCFVDSVAPDGTITYDDHGAYCYTCINEALDTRDAAAQGKTALEIRAQIDAAYGNLGPGTDTPPVAQ